MGFRHFGNVYIRVSLFIDVESILGVLVAGKIRGFLLRGPESSAESAAASEAAGISAAGTAI